MYQSFCFSCLMNFEDINSREVDISYKSTLLLSNSILFSLTLSTASRKKKVKEIAQKCIRYVTHHYSIETFIKSHYVSKVIISTLPHNYAQNIPKRSTSKEVSYHYLPLILVPRTVKSASNDWTPWQNSQTEAIDDLQSILENWRVSTHLERSHYNSHRKEGEKQTIQNQLQTHQSS